MLHVIKSYPLATLISVKDNEPLVTHLPLIYREEDNKLIGHIDASNPQAALLCDNNSVTVLFSGPQCYISPSIYSTPQLPTWNYIKVHVKGTVSAFDNEETVKQSLVSMTEFLEQPDHGYELKMDNPRMHGLIQYIKGFEIHITYWEGKFKLSQDKNPQDLERAKQALIHANKKSVETFLDNLIG